MTTLFVPLHVAPDAKSLPAASYLAFPWFFTCVRVGVYLQRARSRKRLVACATDISVLVRRVRG